jgi:hypothetical protein
VSSNNYNYPEITQGMGELTPAMWSRLMSMLRSHESKDDDDFGILSNESLNSRITDLEIHKPYFFAKLLRARVLDPETLQSPNTYAYAWTEVRPVTRSTDCCEGCLTSRNGCSGDPDDDCFPVGILPCCETSFQCLTYLNYQGLWNWWEDTNNTSWGDTLANAEIPYRFDTTDLTSNYNPLQYPCIDGSCEPSTSQFSQYPNQNMKAYTKPAMNLLEAFNTGHQAGGVDQTKGIGDFMMQAIGGGDTEYDGDPIGENDSSLPQCWDSEAGEPPCTQFEFPLKSTPVVLMHNIRESDGTFRQVFQAANSYDGTCVDCT